MTVLHGIAEKSRNDLFNGLEFMAEHEGSVKAEGDTATFGKRSEGSEKFFIESVGGFALGAALFILPVKAATQFLCIAQFVIPIAKFDPFRVDFIALSYRFPVLLRDASESCFMGRKVGEYGESFAAELRL